MALDFNDKQIHILQVAEKLFAENGYDGTSIRQIAQVAVINIAMVSYYFGSKEKLLESLIYWRTQDLKIQLENLYNEPLTPIQKVEKYVALYIQKINSNRQMYQILQFEISYNKRAMDLESFTAVKKGNLASLNKIIEEGQAAKVFKSNITVPLISPTLIGTFFHFHTNRSFYEEVLNIDSEAKYNAYVEKELTEHIQQIIKSLILDEK